MSLFDEIRSDTNELVQLVRLSERYLTATAANPQLATDSNHATEIERERPIVELSTRLGVTV